MNWFDFLLLGLIGLYTVSGFVRGAVKQLFSLFGFVIALLLAFIGSRLLSETVSQYLDPHSMISYHEALQFLGVEAAVERAAELVAGVLVFLVLFVVLSVLFRLLSGSFQWINKLPVVGLLNRIGGGLVGLIIGVSLCYVLISVASLAPVQLSVDAVSGSKLVAWAEETLPPVAEALKNQLMDFYLRTITNSA
jgi:membrane protein required for colicin V production